MPMSISLEKKKAGNSLHSSRETLVTLRVVVLETNLEFDGLDKVAFLLLGILENIFDGASHT